MAGDDDDLSADWGAALAEQRADSGEEMDDLAAEWGAALEEQGVENADAVAAQWAAMIDDNDADLDASSRGADRVLNQEEIDNLLGFNVEDHVSTEQSGIRSLVNSALVSYER
ncbi:MAG: fliM, partial [Proteobacteria bacterium]|nr:fliM [Pseudomonadota bacterium]